MGIERGAIGVVGRELPHRGGRGHQLHVGSRVEWGSRGVFRQHGARGHIDHLYADLAAVPVDPLDELFHRLLHGGVALRRRRFYRGWRGTGVGLRPRDRRSGEKQRDEDASGDPCNGRASETHRPWPTPSLRLGVGGKSGLVAAAPVRLRERRMTPLGRWTEADPSVDAQVACVGAASLPNRWT